MSADARLAEVLEWLWRSKPPRAVQDKAREILLDTVGCVLAAAAKEPPQHLAQEIRVVFFRTSESRPSHLRNVTSRATRKGLLKVLQERGLHASSIAI